MGSSLVDNVYAGSSRSIGPAGRLFKNTAPTKPSLLDCYYESYDFVKSVQVQKVLLEFSATPAIASIRSQMLSNS
jgi:hypothetical protein